MSSPAAVFDAFGTLLRIPHARHPFRQLLKLGLAQGRRPRAQDTRWLMQNTLGLGEAATALGIRVTTAELQALEASLKAELDSCEAWPDGLEAVALLQAEGVRVAVCSNLAGPYRGAVLRLYPTLDAYGFSCELGTMKPDGKIYEKTCQLLSSRAENAWMIGDSQRCDRDGPRAVGIQGFFLDRQGSKGDYNELTVFARDVLKSLPTDR